MRIYYIWLFGYRSLVKKVLHNYIEIKVYCKIKNKSVMYLVGTGLFFPNTNH